MDILNISAHKKDGTLKNSRTLIQQLINKYESQTEIRHFRTAQEVKIYKVIVQELKELEKTL